MVLNTCSSEDHRPGGCVPSPEKTAMGESDARRRRSGGTEEGSEHRSGGVRHRGRPKERTDAKALENV